MSAIDELLIRHHIDLDQAERALRRVLEPTVPLTPHQLDELQDSGFDLAARIDTDRVLADEALRQRDLGTAYTGTEVATNNSISAGRVRSRAAARELVAVIVDGVQRFPRFQFDEAGRFRTGLDKVTPHVPDDWSWIGYRNYLGIPSLDLDGGAVTPLEWLAAGKPPAAVIAAMGNSW